jgi:hypothetical protein
MYCIKCGNKLGKDDKFCGKCGYNLNQPTNPEPANGINNADHKVLFGVLGFISPIAGLVLYIATKDSEPEAAKTAGICALIRLPISIIMGIFYFIADILPYIS